MQMHSRAARGCLAAAAALVLAAPAIVAQTGHASPAARALGIDTTAFDRAVRPQDDFFRYVNGAWLARTEIPQDRSSWGSFAELSENNQKALGAIVEEAAAGKGAAGGGAAASDSRKVGDLYASFMDTARIAKRGLEPLRGELRAIGGLSSRAQLAPAFARLRRIGVTSPLSVSVGQDQKNSSAYIVSVGQSGLGMPDRSYYLREGAQFDSVRAGYTAYITRLLTLAGQRDPAGAAARIVALERAMAEKQWDRAKNRDRDLTYNKMSVAELTASSPSFGWAPYLRTAGLVKATHVVVRQPDYVRALDTIVVSTPVSTWREYLTFHLLNSFADELPDDYVRARFDFQGRTLSGLKEMRPRWKRGLSEVEGALGEALGRVYVERHFKPSAKARMDTLVSNLRAAFKQGIDELEWMSPETKAQAQAKLAKFTVKIGYPEKWRDYSSLVIRRDDLVGNVMRANAFAYEDMVSRLGKPVDRARWGMTPQTVNAYYNSVNNEIVFPAAILQPPFFNADADDAVNYGGIGAVIGHEISHGFDDQGRKSDGDGNLRDWWSPADAKAFEERASRLGGQYESYTPLGDLKINGRLTMGENIGDLSGLAVAYRAYRLSLNGKEAPVIGGFTGDQRFFLGWAQVWRSKARDEALRQQLLTDSHSPGQYRAFVPLTNFDPFYAAFELKPGDKLYRTPEERVKVW